MFYGSRIKDEIFDIKWFAIFLTFFIAGYIILLNYVSSETLNVDRWSVITSFLDSIFNGEYPYLAKSHMNNPPGPFPFYFLLALPFYLIGEIGYFTLAGFLGFLYFVRKYFSQVKIQILIISILIFSPLYWWELIARSTIFVNMVIILLFIDWFENRRKNKLSDLVLAGFIGGLLSSTRGIVICIFIAYFSYYYLKRRAWSPIIIITASLCAGFIVSLIPLLIWDLNLFLKYNPITLQANFLPSWGIVLFTFLAVLIGLRSKNISDFYRFTGIYLFAIVMSSFIFIIFKVGFREAYLQNGFDISYFIFAIPFNLISIYKENQSKGQWSSNQQR